MDNTQVQRVGVEVGAKDEPTRDAETTQTAMHHRAA